jgi:hypothetical protein
MLGSKSLLGYRLAAGAHGSRPPVVVEKFDDSLGIVA